MPVYDKNGNVLSGTDINSEKWSGKKIVVDGSSITSGGTGLTVPTWPAYLTEFLGVSIYNHSVSGSNWLWTYSVPSSYSRLGDYEAAADAIVLMGDFSTPYTSLGTISDSPDIEGGTYYARLKGYAAALIAAFPLIPVVWAVEPPRNWELHNDPAARQEAVAKAIREVGELYGFPIADCLHNTIYRPYNQTNYAANTSDGTHPYRNIQKGMAQTIVETLKRTPLAYSV